MEKIYKSSLCFLLLCAACGKGSGGAPHGSAPATSAALLPPEEVDAGPTRKAEKGAAAGERVKIEGGAMTVGSTPGDEGRDPLLEPTLLAVELGPFEIDKLPFPNDPTKPPRTAISRDEARSLCQQRGGRLCTEIEWERACKGPGGDLYGAGNRWDPSCAQNLASCASGFGVLGLGAALREWTDSDAPAPEGGDRRVAVARGAAPTEEDANHRCARRALLDASSRGPELGFRCCWGPPNAAAVPAPRSGEPTVSKTEIDLKIVSKILSASPRLAPYARDLAFFKEEEAIKAVLQRGDAGAARPGPVLTTSPILWSAVPTEEVVVLALKSKNASLIVALFRLGEDRYRLGSSLVLKDEAGPVVLSYTSFNKKRVLWSTCWECSGEQGSVEYRDNRRLVILHH
jgi:formylglycine-generating enzyme required for sulfatase activity